MAKAKVKKATIMIDRTSLNLCWSGSRSFSQKEFETLSKLMVEIAEREERTSKLLMDVEVELEKAKILFPDEDIENKKYLCLA